MNEIMKKYRNNYVEGQRIGSLTFVKRYELDKKGDSPKAYFLCECGNQFVTRILTAKDGRVKSCGCKTSEFKTTASTKDFNPTILSEPVVCPLERASGGVERYGPRRTFSLHPEGIYF